MKNFKNVIVTLSLLLCAQTVVSMQKSTQEKPTWLKTNDDMVHAVRTGDTAFIKNSKIPADRARMIRDANNNNLLHMAAESNQLPVVKLLIEEYQITPITKNKQGKTPLDVAKAKGYHDIATYLTTKESATPARSSATPPTPPTRVESIGAMNRTATPPAPTAPIQNAVGNPAGQVIK